MSITFTIEEPDTSQYTDYETVEREWSAQEIYRSLVMRSEGEDGLLIPAAGLEECEWISYLVAHMASPWRFFVFYSPRHRYGTSTPTYRIEQF